MTLKGKRVLYISYNGMLDPLGQSQVLPYLRELSEAKGICFTLLSYERPAAFSTEGVARCDALKQSLAENNIEWHRLRYHQRPSLPATVYDVKRGVRYAETLVRRNGIEMVHARSHIPAAIALALKKAFGLKMIFDVRGLMAEEYADAGHWQKGGLKYRLTKNIERRCFAAADGVVTLTEAIWAKILHWEGLKGREVAHQMIPCCVDLQRFRFDVEERERRRAKLCLHDKFVLVYSGSIGGWYLTREMADFFVTLMQQRSDAHFLWLTTGSHAQVESLMQERGIAANRFTVRSVSSEEVASYLSASDVGLAFYKPGFSKLATSPVKVTEYLACGIPVIINSGIGDSDEIVTRERVGALVQDFTARDYLQAAQTINRMLEDVTASRRHTRAVAERLFDVRRVGLERYARLYEDVFDRVSG